MPLLEVENLSVTFPSRVSSIGGVLHAVDGVSMTLDKGEVLGIVGESGSGKSVGMLAVMGLVPFPGRVTADKLLFEGRDLMGLSDAERRALTGKDIAMIFQEPTTSLNPSFTIGFQIMETLQIHLGLDRKRARRRAIELMEQVGIPAPESRLSAYPHQMSGGMNQRVMIAMAIACNPKLLIADEPTTALDVTIQAQILDLLLSLQRDHGTCPGAMSYVCTVSGIWNGGAGQTRVAPSRRRFRPGSPCVPSRDRCARPPTPPCGGTRRPSPGRAPAGYAGRCRCSRGTPAPR